MGSYTVEGDGELNLRTGPFYSYNQFLLFAEDTAPPTVVTGSINGIDVEGINMDILNNTPPIDMLSSPSLPASAGFSGLANLVEVDIENFGDSKTIAEEFEPGGFTFTATSSVPEPATGLLGLAGCALLCGATYRQQRGKKRRPGPMASPSYEPALLKPRRCIESR